MANIKSDEVKQSLDNLEKHHLFTEGELKPVWILTLQDHTGRRNVSFTHTPSINSRRKKQLRNVFKKFLPVWYIAGVVCIECLLIFGTYSVGFILGS